jgi:hypothetical protein
MSDRNGLSIFDDHDDPAVNENDAASTQVIPVVTASVQRQRPPAPAGPAAA